MTKDEAIFELRYAKDFQTPKRKKAIDMAIEALSIERTGYWIEDSEWWYQTRYRCSECGKYVSNMSNYCSDCGARMMNKKMTIDEAITIGEKNMK